MGFVPDDWKVANVCPIYKKGCDKTLPNANRPVSITSVISKFFKRIIRLKILNYLNKKDLLSKFQHGFCEKKSTLSNLLDC